MESPTAHPLKHSSSHSFWNSKEKLNQLSLPQLFSYLKVLEDLIQHKFNQLLWGISSVLSESVVATAWVSRKSSPGEGKTVRFRDTRGPAQALSLAKGPPQLCQDQSVPNQLVTPSLVDVTGGQNIENLPNATPNQTPSFQSRSHRTCPSTEIGIQVSLPTLNEPCQQELNWKDITGCNVQKCQTDISQSTDNLSRGTLPTKVIRSASILPEHYQMVHHHEEPQHEEREINVGEQQGTHVRLPPSRELTELHGDFQPNSDGYCKNLPELNQPAKPSNLNSESYKCSQMVGSIPIGILLKKAISKYGIPNTIKKDLSVKFKDLPCTSSSTPGKGLEPKNTPLRTDKLSFLNTTEDISCLDPKTQMKLDSNMQLPSVSKAEYYSKAAMILEKLHHQDPGGKRVETVSLARLRNPMFQHSPPEVKETQRAPPPATSHGPSRSHPGQQERNQNFQPHTISQQSNTIRGTGKGILKPNKSLEMSMHTPWKMSEDVASGHPSWSATTVVNEMNTLKVKQEPPHSSRVILGSGKIPNGQAMNFSLKDFGSIEAKRSLGNFQTPTPPNLGDLDFKTKNNKIDMRANKQSQAWSVNHHPGGPNIVYPAKMSLPSQDSLPSFQNVSKYTKTSQGLGDLIMSSYQTVETQKYRVYKNKIEAKNDGVFHPHKESILKSGVVNQGERLGRGRSSSLSSTQHKYTAKTQNNQSSLNIAEKSEAPSKNNMKNITRNYAQYENICTKYMGQGDSLKNESPPPATEQTQEVVERVNLIYSTAAELQSLMNSLVQNFDNDVGDPSKLTKEPITQVSDYKEESLTFQLGDSSHAYKGLHDPNHSKPARRMSGSHTSSKEHSHSFTFGRTEDKLQSAVDSQKACDEDPNKSKIEIGFDQLSTPMGNDHPCGFMGVGDKQELGLVVKGAGDPGQIGTEIKIGGFQYGIPNGHNHSFRITEIRDKQEPDIDHKALDPYQNVKKGMGHVQPMSPKENHPVKHRGIGDQEQSSIAAQGTSDPDEIKTKSERECSPHRSPQEHNHLLRYCETRDKQQSSVNAQRAYDKHPNSLKIRMGFGNPLTPKEKNHPLWHRIIRDRQPSGHVEQRDWDRGQIKSGMGSCLQRSPKGQNVSFRNRDIGEKVLPCGNSQRICDQRPSSVKRKGFEQLPTRKGKSHPHSYKVTGNKQQSNLTDQRACDPSQIKKKDGMGTYTFKFPEGYNFLFRYGVTENKQEPLIVHRACDPHQCTKEGIGRGQPMSPEENYSVKDKRIGGQDHSGVAAQGAFDLR
ncbi:uncharacterized protein LOC117722690 isoform X2 [Arvicanthis niloticus]